MNTIQWNIGMQYTLIELAGVFANRSEITVSQKLEDAIIGRLKNQRKTKVLSLNSKRENVLVFLGHNLPFLLETETNSFMTTLKVTFVTNEPAKLRAYLEEHCLNLTDTLKGKINYRSDTLPIHDAYRPLFNDHQAEQ